MSETGDKAAGTGGCLCGAVRYRVSGPLREIIACHCGQCRRTSGHHTAATAAARGDLEIAPSGTLAWYESSPGIRRGFCNTCGSSLFWDDETRDYVAIFAGSLDSPTGLKLVKHIYTADKGDYYEIADGLPALPQGQAWD